MPSLRDAHLAKADRYKQLTRSHILPKPADQVPLEWAIVTGFYAALHYVQAYLATQGIVPASHTAREAAIRRDKQVLWPIYSVYLELQGRSEDVRYEAQYQPTDQDLQQTVRQLAQVEAAVRRALRTGP
jgi:hypothetical protein